MVHWKSSRQIRHATRPVLRSGSLGVEGLVGGVGWGGGVGWVWGGRGVVVCVVGGVVGYNT